MDSSSQFLARVGILSIGDMGAGIARLLLAHNYHVATNVSDRSPATQARAAKHNIAQHRTDLELVNQSDYILSIVPPRDALATAQRIATAASSPSFQTRPHPLVYLDLNAISPASARQIHDVFGTRAPEVVYLDGGIIGGPPSPKAPASQDDGAPTPSTPAAAEDDGATWNRPSIPLSGPIDLTTAPYPSATHLARILRIQHISPEIGPAAGLKMCFAALSKGFTALAIQSFSTAANLGVLGELEAQLAAHNPHALHTARRSLPAMCPKAYRWVREMEEIAATMEVDGGFEAAESSFRSIARVYELIADGTVLGEEKVGERVRGTDARDVARWVCEGTVKRKQKTE